LDTEVKISFKDSWCKILDQISKNHIYLNLVFWGACILLFQCIQTLHNGVELRSHLLVVPIFILCVGSALLQVILVLLNISMQKFFNLCCLMDESNFVEASQEPDGEDKKAESPPGQGDRVDV
jgi:hypothetical protein